jgi:hypothetical protein
MGTVGVALGITVAEDKRILPVRRPHISELGGIPKSLVSHLWHTDGMRRWACGTSGKSSRLGVIHVRLVVGTIEVLAVPACGKVVLSHNAAFAWLLREVIDLREPRGFGIKAGEPKALVLDKSICALSRAANRHTEARREGPNEFVSIRIEILLGIIDGHSAIYSSWQGIVRHNRHTLV